jgi:hypothetical protein
MQLITLAIYRQHVASSWVRKDSCSTPLVMNQDKWLSQKDCRLDQYTNKSCWLHACNSEHCSLEDCLSPPCTPTVHTTSPLEIG